MKSAKYFCWSVMAGCSLIFVLVVAHMIYARQFDSIHYVGLFECAGFSFMSCLLLEKSGAKADPSDGKKKIGEWLGTRIYGYILIVVSGVFGTCFGVSWSLIGKPVQDVVEILTHTFMASLMLVCMQFVARIISPWYNRVFPENNPKEGESSC
jgi:hypothetical protein